MKAAWLSVVVVLLALGCAKSEQASWAGPCFEARELESWSERHDDPCTVETVDGVGGEIKERRVNVFGDDGWVSTTTYASGEIAEKRVEYTDQSLVRSLEEYGRDGELLSRTEHVFDDESALIRDEIDLDGDGALDIVSTYDYSCMPDGPSSSLGFNACTVSHDLDDDGDIDGMSFTIADSRERTERVIYDPYTEEIVRRVEERGDGAFPSRVFEDVGNDGSIDRIEGTDRDEEIGVTRHWIDDDADGTMDWWIDSQSNGIGRQRSIEMDSEGVVRRYDIVREGNAEQITDSYPRTPKEDRVIERRYDDAGNFIAGAADYAPLGSIDSCAYASYACLER